MLNSALFDIFRSRFDDDPPDIGQTGNALKNFPTE